MQKMPKWWRAIVIASLLVILGTFLADLFIPLDEGQRKILEFLDLAAIVVLAVDLFVAYRKTKEKGKFLFRNWLLIISFIPFASFIRVLRYFKVIKATLQGGISKGIHVIGHVPRIARLYRVIVVGLSKTKQRVSAKIRGKPKA